MGTDDTEPKPTKNTTAPARQPAVVSSAPITKSCEKAVYGLLETGMKTGKTPAVRPDACNGLTDDQWAIVVGAQSEKVADAKPAGPLTTFGDGTYLVGEDIAVGSYRTPGPEKSSYSDMCYWSRKKNDSGEFEAIIANEIVRGPGRVTVKKGEFFETNSCQDWVLVK